MGLWGLYRQEWTTPTGNHREYLWQLRSCFFWFLHVSWDGKLSRSNRLSGNNEESVPCCKRSVCPWWALPGWADAGLWFSVSRPHSSTWWEAGTTEHQPTSAWQVIQQPCRWLSCWLIPHVPALAFRLASSIQWWEAGDSTTMPLTLNQHHQWRSSSSEPRKTHACDGHLWLYLWWSHGRPCDPSDDGTGAAAVLCSYANAWASVCWSAELTDHTGGRQLGSHTPCKAPDTLGAQVPFQGPQLQPGTTSCGAMLRVSLSTFCTGCNSAFRT